LFGLRFSNNLYVYATFAPPHCNFSDHHSPSTSGRIIDRSGGQVKLLTASRRCPTMLSDYQGG
jgi:hypothetical protein